MRIFLLQSFRHRAYEIQAYRFHPLHLLLLFLLLLLQPLHLFHPLHLLVFMIAQDMHQRCSQLLEEGLETVNEDVIADEVLGTRPGYIPGMGYGPKPVSYSRKRQPSSDTIALHERLSTLQNEYEERISSLKQDYEERMLRYEVEMSQMRELMQQFMAQNSCSGDGTSSSRFRFPPPPPPPPSAAC